MKKLSKEEIETFEEEKKELEELVEKQEDIQTSEDDDKETEVKEEDKIEATDEIKEDKKEEPEESSEDEQKEVDVSAVFDKVIESLAPEKQEELKLVKEEFFKYLEQKDEIEQMSSEENESVPLSQFTEVIQLNEKAIDELKEAELRNDAYKKMNEQLMDSMETMTSELGKIREKEEQIKTEKVNRYIDKVADKWVDVHNLPSKEVPAVREMLSTFGSEDKLREIERQLNMSYTKTREQPKVKTIHSTKLQEKSDDNSTKQKYKKLSPQGKTDYLFEMLEKINRG